MAKVLRVVGKVAGVVASVASFIPGVGQVVAAVAGAVALVAGVAAGAAGPKKPNAVGSVTAIQIASNAALPYMMGRTYCGGAEIHRAAFGGTLNKIPNPYLARTIVYSVAGPIDAIEAVQTDFATLGVAGTAATGYYSGFLWVAKQLGATPEAAALTANFAGEPNWGSGYKLSGYTAAKYTLKFDKDGKVFASGEPQLGIVGRGVKVYDPRLDSTYPGGSGSHRINNEATWVYSNNPALHALAYAYGRKSNGKHVFGAGLGDGAIDLANVVAWANLCEANGWVISGVIFEPADVWNNLKLIAEAGGAVPSFSGGLLHFSFASPVVSIDTITIDDLADGALAVPAMQTLSNRINGAIPRYRSEANKWEMVQSDLISVSAFVTADGEVKDEEFAFATVADKDQAAELAGYKLYNGRERAPITLTLKPRMVEYRIGDALTANLPEFGLASQVMIVTGRAVDPLTGTVTLTFTTETATKHAAIFALTGTEPPAAVLYSGETRDTVAGATTRTIDIEELGIEELADINAAEGAKLTGVEIGADVTLTAQVAVEIADGQNKTIAADYLGNVTGTYPVFVPVVTRNGVSIKDDAGTTYTATKLSDGTTGADGGTIALASSGTAKGNVTPSAFTSTGTLESRWRLTVFVQGIVVAQRDCTLTKVLGDPPSGGGGGSFATVSADAAVNWTAYTGGNAHTASSPSITLAAGDDLRAYTSVSYSIPEDYSNTSIALTMRFRYSTDGGTTWTSFGTAVQGSVAYAGYYDFGSESFYSPHPGYIAMDQTVTAPGAGTYLVKAEILSSWGGATASLSGANIRFEAVP